MGDCCCLCVRSSCGDVLGYGVWEFELRVCGGIVDGMCVVGLCVFGWGGVCLMWAGWVEAGEECGGGVDGRLLSALGVGV